MRILVECKSKNFDGKTQSVLRGVATWKTYDEKDLM